MLNALGLGLILTMRDYASMPAGRIQRALLGLDETARQFSYRFIVAMYQAREGMDMMATGTVALLAPFGILASSFETQSKLYQVVAQGLTDINLLLDKSLEISNKYAGITRANFMEAAYWIRSGMYWLSDEEVAKFAANATIVAKATRADTEEMANLFATAHGIFKDLYRDMSDEQFMNMFAGGLTEAVRAFKTEGHQMVLAFNDLNADASAVLYNMEEQLAALGLLQQTMPGSRAGTRLRAFVQGAIEAAQEFNYPITDAEGHLLNIADLVDRIKKDFVKIPEGFDITKYETIEDAMKAIEISSGAQVKNIYALRKAFGSREAFSVLQLLWNRTDQLREMQEIVRNGMMQGMTVAERMAYIIDQGIGERLQILQQRVHNFFELITEAIQGPAKAVIDFASSFMILAQNFIKTNPTIVKLTFSIVTLTGALLFLAGVIWTVIGIQKLMSSTMYLAIQRTFQMIQGMKLLFTTFTPIILAISALYLAYKSNFAGIRDILDSIGNRMKQFAYNTVMVIRGLWQLVTSLNNLRYGYISAELKSMLESLGLWDFVKHLFMGYVRIKIFLTNFVTSIENTFEIIKAIVTPMIDIIYTIFKPIISLIMLAGRAFGFLGESVTESDVEKFRLFGKVLGSILGPLVAFKSIGWIFNSIKTVQNFFAAQRLNWQKILTNVLTPIKIKKLTGEAKKAYKEVLWALDEMQNRTMSQATRRSMKALIYHHVKKYDLQDFFPEIAEQMKKMSTKTKVPAQTIRKSFWQNFIGYIFTIPSNIVKLMQNTTKRIQDSAKFIQQFGIQKGISTLIKNIIQSANVQKLKNFSKQVLKWLITPFSNLWKFTVRFFDASERIIRAIERFVIDLYKAFVDLIKAVFNFAKVFLKAMIPVFKQFGMWIWRSIVSLAKFSFEIGKTIIKDFIQLVKWIGIAIVKLAIFAGRTIMAAVTSLVNLGIALGQAVAGFIAMALSLGPVLLITLAVIALGLAVYLLWKNWDKVVQKFNEFKEGIIKSPLIQKIIEIGKYIKDHIVDPIIKALEAVAKFLGLDTRSEFYGGPNGTGASPIPTTNRQRVKLPTEEPINFIAPYAAGQNDNLLQQLQDMQRYINVANQMRSENVVYVQLDGKTVAQAIANRVDNQNRRRVYDNIPK
ncbi:phage tail tape measure protein [Thermosipho sp. (in: thermotogales)]|jgi:hypothetical protein|uniref:phage tail tape measure protein n=1 Tax=Thermosipho sp. (in: thermotogales) TaxID=1968895 RepID=UPI00257E23B2|nr:phage tail tape measure protein [Thermosipho sp. (in: thermotogales)]MBZ4649177.1 phage tail tape measure protein family [Thermosipho sp. (in: thermotogales)]